jgi:transcription antitermination factor NusG
MIQSATSYETQPDSWFVIWTESRAEKKVEARLAALGLSPCLPSVKERHRWSDRWREVVCPLFPGYLFARARSVEWHKVLRTPGVLTVVKRGAHPALLPDGFIAGLRDAIGRNGAAPEPVAEEVDYRPGDEVVIVQEGALKGVRGVVRERKSGRQLVIWVSEIGRGVAFTIGSALVTAAGGGVAPEGVAERVDYTPGDEVIAHHGVLRSVRGCIASGIITK